MSADLIFSICNTAILPAWLLLVFAPRWRWTLGIITTAIVPFILALVYGGLILSRLSVMPEGGGFGSLNGVATLFSDPYLLTMGWVHYLAFDLFVGSFEVHDAQKQGIPHWQVIPCLAFTLMLGPVGFGLYLALRFFSKRKLVVFEQIAA